MKVKELVFGARKSPLDPKVFERLALAAFLAWERTAWRFLKRLDRLRDQVEAEPAREGVGEIEKDPRLPTAVVLVRSYGGAGIHTFVFVSVGDIDFKGAAEVVRLKESVQAELDKYVALVRKWGCWGDARSAVGVDVVDEAVSLCRSIATAAFFAGQPAFEQPGMITRLLHEQTAPEIQRRLQFAGLTLVVLPIRVLGTALRADT